MITRNSRPREARISRSTSLRAAGAHHFDTLGRLPSIRRRLVQRAGGRADRRVGAHERTRALGARPTTLAHANAPPFVCGAPRPSGPVFRAPKAGRAKSIWLGRPSRTCRAAWRMQMLPDASPAAQKAAQDPGKQRREICSSLPPGERPAPA